MQGLNWTHSDRPTYAPLQRDYYDRDPVVVARQLLGMLLCRRLPGDRLLVGRITETEAYLAREDTANHAHRGQTRRNRSMFGPPGHAYVYAIHSRHCLNVVTEPPGVASAVLIRAVEPLEGIDVMARLRGTDQLRNLTTGPGKLCEAFAINRDLDGEDMTRPIRLWIADGGSVHDAVVACTPRIGVTSAKELPLRFVLRDTPFVSRRPPRR